MNDIRVEYARLKEMASTEDGFKLIDSAWLKITDGTRDLKINHGVGGFALDLETGYFTSSSSSDHSGAKKQLIDWLTLTKGIPVDDAELRPITGWWGKILDFEHCCIFLGSWMFTQEDMSVNWEVVSAVEECLLKQNAGLPLIRAFFENHERVKKKKRRGKP